MASTNSKVDHSVSGSSASADRWQVPKWLQQLAGWSWRLLVAGVLFYFALRLLVILRLIVLPVLVGLLAAALLGPLKARVSNGRIPTLAGTWLVFLAGLGIVFVLVVGAGVLVGNEFADTAQWSETRQEVRTWLETGPAGLDESEVADLEARVDSSLRSGVGSFSSDRALMIGEMLGALFLSLALSFFFIKDGPEIWSWLTSRLRPGRRESVDRAGLAAFKALRGFMRGVAITGLVDAVLIGAVLLVLDVPLALPLAILTFFAAFLPIVGATAVGAASTVIALVANGPQTAVAVGVATLIIQQVEGDVVMPLVMRRTVSLHPIVVLVSLAIGGTLGGIAGAFVAVPVAAMVAAGAPELRGDQSADAEAEPMDADVAAPVAGLTE